MTNQGIKSFNFAFSFVPAHTKEYEFIWKVFCHAAVNSTIWFINRILAISPVRIYERTSFYELSEFQLLQRHRKMFITSAQPAAGFITKAVESELNFHAPSLSIWILAPAAASEWLGLRLLSSKISLGVLQPLRWRCVECAIHHERDVREEQHPYKCGANKQ